MFHIQTYDWGWQKSITFQRPGLELKLYWHRTARKRALNWNKTYIEIALPHVGAFLILKPRDLVGHIVRCSKCRRMWPGSSQSPIPGDAAEWARITGEARGRFGGEWCRDMDFVNGEYVYQPWHWLGPCCVDRHSGEYEDEWDEDEEDWDEEDWDEEDWDDYLKDPDEEQIAIEQELADEEG